MNYEHIMNLVGLSVFLIFGMFSILFLRRYNRIETPPDCEPPEILTGEHLRVKQMLKDIPPGTRVPEADERKT